LDEVIELRRSAKTEINDLDANPSHFFLIQSGVNDPSMFAATTRMHAHSLSLSLSFSFLSLTCTHMQPVWRCSKACTERQALILKRA